MPIRLSSPDRADLGLFGSILRDRQLQHPSETSPAAGFENLPPLLTGRGFYELLDDWGAARSLICCRALAKTPGSGVVRPP